MPPSFASSVPSPQQPLWMSVLPTTSATTGTFVIVRCYDAATWARRHGANSEAQRPPPRPLTTRAPKRPREPSPVLAYGGTLDNDDDNALVLADVARVSGETTHSHLSASEQAPTRPSDVLDVSVVMCVAEAGPRSAAGQAPVRVWVGQPRGQSVEGLVPRGMIAATYSALLDGCVRRQDAARPGSTSSPALTSVGEVHEDVACEEEDDAVLYVDVRDTSAGGTDTGAASRRVDLSLRSASTESAVRLLSWDVVPAGIDGSDADEGGAATVMRAWFTDMATQLRTHESMRATLAAQAHELVQLRRGLDAATARQVCEEALQPLEAVVRVVNAKKARIVELTATVDALRQQLQDARVAGPSVEGRGDGVHHKPMRTPSRAAPTTPSPPPATATVSVTRPEPARRLPSRASSSTSTVTQDTDSTSTVDEAPMASDVTPSTDTAQDTTPAPGKQEWLNDLFAL